MILPPVTCWSGQLIVSAWCVGWLGFIKTHSGGAWTGDSYEHWERAHFFLRGWPADRLFIDLFPLPARPPLANVLTAAFMEVTRPDYARTTQSLLPPFSAAWPTLPVGLLAWRFGGRSAARMAAVLVMVNPLFAQNATYPWTKLPAVLFILTGLYFYLRVRDDDEARERSALLCALTLGGAVVTHYSKRVPMSSSLPSSGSPWVSSAGWRPPFPRMTLVAVAAGACVLAPWFVWSVVEYGSAGTFLTNSSITTLDKWHGSHLLKVALNLRDTLIPPQVRGFSGTLFVQTSPWGRLRDQGFLLYQLNLLFAVGCVAWIAVAWEGVRQGLRASRADRIFWTVALTGFVLASIAVYGDREHFGITHICLQSVVLLALAFLASRWDRFGPVWRSVLVAGWAVDLAFGILLQFAVEDYAIDRWLTPGRSEFDIARTYNGVSQANLQEKISAGLVYYSERLTAAPGLLLALLAALLLMAVARWTGAGKRES